MTAQDCAALIVAAGRGERFGGDVPKQYRHLAGRPILRHTVEAFLGHEAVGRVCVVIDPAHRALCDAALAGLPVGAPVDGGSDRQESVRLGLETLAAEPPARVLIQDGVRPLTDAATIARVCAALDRGPAAIAAIPVADTLKRAADGVSLGTVDRTGLWRAQTPQGFDFQAILTAHRGAGATATDDAAVAERAGLPVQLVPGHVDNLKVTTEEDLRRAERLLAAGQADIRVGNGYDVHRFGAGNHVMLCGVAVPHSHGLQGHSDADVGLHALTDAVLGALGDGDIGRHFPPGDPRWRDADSGRFLRHAADLVAVRNGRIGHVDVTLICERPRIGSHRAAMVARVAELLGPAGDAATVSVKATTTEGLGFIGRGEGIAAQATATIRLPSTPTTAPISDSR
ncbi:MAG: bifunctional 2-C-methyl-D-erythritol 4-phosphate cytidylyltransferase/2-C-methyl-D-erythritol 2,4-cyclodiphosphate synthase [Alphaproteobacteria bacterium]